MTDDSCYSYKTITTRRDGSSVDGEVTRFPPSVQPVDIFDFFVDLLGSPIEEAVTDTDDLRRVSIGWVFPAPVDADPSVRDLTVVPMITIAGHANPVSMFLYQEELKANFAATMNEAGIEVDVVNPVPRDQSS